MLVVMKIMQTKNGPLEYRVENPDGKQSVLILHGGHMNASIRLGEDYFVQKGYKTIVVSRPGYGQTPLQTGETPVDFAAALADLLDELQVDKVTPVGISAGGRSAIALAQHYPERVEKLILQCSVSYEKWPDVMTNIAAHIAFNSFMEKYTWAMMRFFLKKKPRMALKLLLGSMTTKDVNDVASKLSDEQVSELVNIFNHSRSGKGFLADIRAYGGSAAGIKAPTLIIHSKFDASVPMLHALTLQKQINGSELYVSEAESHMIWFSAKYKDIQKKMDEFLAKTL